MTMEFRNCMTYLCNSVQIVTIVFTHLTYRESLPAYLCLTRPDVCVCL